MRLGMWQTALTVATIAAGAASAQAQDTRADRNRQTFRAEVEDRETRSLTLGVNGTLALSNFAGDITVRTGDVREARLEIVRRARGRTEADARRGLERIRVLVDERANRATVESAHVAERNAPYFVVVTYDVVVPSGTTVSIQSLTGNIDARGLAGELSAVTTTGNVAIRDARRLSRARSATGSVVLSNVQNDGTIEAGTIAGPITVEALRARRLVIDSVTGGVSAHDATADRAELSSTTGDIEYSGPMAADGRYELRSHSGNLRFLPASGGGFELRATSFAGNIVPDDALGLEVVRSGSRELVATSGDGRAVVTLTTFSGRIVITRR